MAQPEQRDEVEMLATMLLIRRFEERASQQYQAQKIGGFCHLYIGQEAVVAGAIAASAAVCVPLLDWLQNHPFFARNSPKTTGRETFGDAYFKAVLEAAHRFGATGEQTIATLTASTAAQIAKSVPASTNRVIASGGGASNDTLMANLRSALAACVPSQPIVSRSDEFGMPADAKEAMAFALLARETILGRPGNAPGATGARRPVILGKIVPGGNFSVLLKAV